MVSDNNDSVPLWTEPVVGYVLINYNGTLGARPVVHEFTDAAGDAPVDIDQHDALGPDHSVAGTIPADGTIRRVQGFPELDPTTGDPIEDDSVHTCQTFGYLVGNPAADVHLYRTLRKHFTTESLAIAVPEACDHEQGAQ